MLKGYAVRVLIMAHNPNQGYGSTPYVSINLNPPEYHTLELLRFRLLNPVWNNKRKNILNVIYV